MTLDRYGGWMTTPGDVGMLIIRVWREDAGDPPELRARLTESLDVSRDELTIANSANIDGVCDEVRAWLWRFVDDDSASAAAGPVGTEPDQRRRQRPDLASLSPAPGSTVTAIVGRGRPLHEVQVSEQDECGKEEAAEADEVGDGGEEAIRRQGRVELDPA